MKTLFTHFRKLASTPPAYLLVLFAWLLMPVNSYADPIAIGTGTVTLNKSNPSNPTAPITNTWTMTSFSEECIYYSDGDNVIFSDVDWVVTIVPGIYDITITCGVRAWGISAIFSIIDPDTDGSVNDFYDIPWESGAGGTEKNKSTSLSDVDLTGLNSGKTYIIRAKDRSGGHFCVGHISFTRKDGGCANSVSVSYKKSGSETGSAPADREVCKDNTSTITLPGKNTLVYDTKHAFFGWEKGGEIYAEGATYTITDADISAGSIEFTAVWSEVNVTDLTITDPVNNTIPLSWKIPGICDIKHGGTPIFTPDNGSGYYGTLTNSTYNNEGDYITAEGITPQYGQYGIGFDIPATKELSWLSYEWKGSYGNIWLCGAVCDNGHAYWQLGSQRALDNYSEFTERGKLYPDQIYWDKGAMPAGAKVSQVVIYANAGGYADDVSFSVRNVRYGITGRADIDHIVLVRKAGSVPANKDDGNVIYNGTKSHFTDTDVKTPGTTYYYAVFAVYSDASVSSPVYVSHTMETVDTYNVTYAKGGEDVTGDVPVDETEYAATNSVTVAGKNTLARPGHHFAGWNDGSTTYAPGVSYTMPAHDVTFTAVWTPFTVPMVTNLSTSAENEVVTLTYSIPGICDLSNPVEPKYQQIGNTTKKEYKAADYVEIEGNTPGDNQFGVAFAIPTTTNIDWLSFDYRGSVAWNVNLWGGLCDAEDGRNAYWQFASPMTIHPNDAENWSNSGQLRPNQAYWQAGDISNPVERPISQIAVYANASGSQTNDISFEVKNVRYHVANQEDIHHVVIMRKAGQDQASTGLDDGTLLEPGTRSRFVDEEAKSAGWYTYTVFAVHADGTLSTGVSVNVEIVAKEPHTVTYALGGGTGTLPTEPSHVEGASFTVANGDGLSYAGHTFAGWNDGTGDYAPGASYTMPDDNVTLTAQWTPFTVPTVTNLSLNGDMKTVNLSWKIPGFIDLNTTKTTPSSSFSTAYGSFTYASDATVNSDGELVVTYSAAGGGSITGFLFDVNLSNVEAVYYDYKGDYTGSGWDGIFPGIYCSTNSTMYWEGGSHDLKNVDWQSKEITTFTGFWKSGTYASENISELGFFANACNDAVENGHMYIRNLRYHCTGQIDIDHIVLVRKDGSAPADPTDGVVLPAGNRFAFEDADDSKEEGHTYYYKVFSVHADGSYSAPEAVYYTVPALTTYTRENLRVGDFGTICLPYAIEAANREGVELFEIDSWAEDGTSMTMTQLNADETMEAGRPYIFQATANTATFRYYEVGEPAEAGSHNGLIGSYVEIELTPNDDNYIIYQNKLYLVNSANVWCGDHRAYIHKGATTPSSAPRRRVTMGLYGTQTATGIDNLQVNDVQPTKLMENGVLYILRDGKTYNAQGQLVK